MKGDPRNCCMRINISAPGSCLLLKCWKLFNWNNTVLLCKCTGQIQLELFLGLFCCLFVCSFGEFCLYVCWLFVFILLIIGGQHTSWKTVEQLWFCLWYKFILLWKGQKMLLYKNLEILIKRVHLYWNTQFNQYKLLHLKFCFIFFLNNKR